MTAVQQRQPGAPIALGKEVLACRPVFVISRVIEVTNSPFTYLSVRCERKSDHRDEESGNSIDRELLLETFSCIISKSAEHFQPLWNAEIVSNTIIDGALLLSPLLPLLHIRYVVADQDLLFGMITLDECDVLSDERMLR